MKERLNEKAVVSRIRIRKMTGGLQVFQPWRPVHL